MTAEMLIPEKEIIKELGRIIHGTPEERDIIRKRAAAKISRDMGLTGRLEVTRRKNGYFVRTL